MSHISQHAALFPAVVRHPDRFIDRVITRETSRLSRIAQALADAHGTPNLGNKRDPVDELVYIALSRRTREPAYQAAYDALRRRWPTWDALADAALNEVVDAIRSGGLATRKAHSIVGALQRIRATFGTCELRVDDWPDDEIAAFLAGLPEIGPKTAACIMAMSLDRAAFAVDAHVGRVMSRIAPYDELGLDLHALDHKQRQAVLPALIPPRLRRDLHVNLVAHGRTVCRTRTPNCERCPVRSWCKCGATRSLDVRRQVR